MTCLRSIACSGDVPLWLLEPARKHWDALQSMGLRTLSDLRSLPRSGLARRFGEPLLDAVDRARGARPDPREFIVLPERFGSSFVHALTPPSRYCMARHPGHPPGHLGISPACAGAPLHAAHAT
jgi:hypothetical protein